MSSGPTYWLRFISLYLTWRWLESECRPSRQSYPLDMGIFLYGVGFALIPYYMWRSQRWRGMLKTAALIAMWIASYVFAAATAWLLEARAS